MMRSFTAKACLKFTVADLKHCTASRPSRSFGSPELRQDVALRSVLIRPRGDNVWRNANVMVSINRGTPIWTMSTQAILREQDYGGDLRLQHS